MKERRKKAHLDRLHDPHEEINYYFSPYNDQNPHRDTEECTQKIDNLFVLNRVLYAFMLIRQFIKRFLFMDFYMFDACDIMYGMNVLCES